MRIQPRQILALLALVLCAGSSLAATHSPTACGIKLTPAEPGATGAPNPAGISIELSSGVSFEAGSRVIFLVSVKKAGYLILIDIDANGKTQQIYPNLQSMQMPPGARDSANFIRPGRPVKVPDPQSLIANFEFVAEPPAGSGMIVALLSPHLVQLVDMPDVPAEMLGTPAAVDFIHEAAKALKIQVRGGQFQLADPEWSLAAQIYSIR